MEPVAQALVDALLGIVYGTQIDKHNRDDDGLIDIREMREPFRKRIQAAREALNQAGVELP